MPKVAINKYDDVFLPGHKVGATGQVSCMLLPGYPELPDGFGYDFFRACIPAFYPGHQGAALLDRHNVPAARLLSNGASPAGHSPSFGRHASRIR